MKFLNLLNKFTVITIICSIIFLSFLFFFCLTFPWIEIRDFQKNVIFQMDMNRIHNFIFGGLNSLKILSFLAFLTLSTLGINTFYFMFSKNGKEKFKKFIKENK